MLLRNKKILQSVGSLLNEKLLFKFDAKTSSNYKNLLIRLHVSVVSFPKADTISYSLLSMQMFLPKPNRLSFATNRLRFVTKYELSRTMCFRIFPQIYYSYIHTYFACNHGFPFPSKWPVCMRSNNGIGVSFSRKSVSVSEHFDEYFYGIVDADTKYGISVLGQTGVGFNSRIYLNLYSSLVSFPLLNMSRSGSNLRGK
jgi:hypothetical protein